MPMDALDSSPLSSGIREKSVVALCCSTSFVIARGFPSLRDLQPRYRQGLALLHYNDGDQFLHTKNRSILSRQLQYRGYKKVKDQATLEIVYLKPREEQLCMVIEPEVTREMKCHGKSYISTRTFCLKRNEQAVFWFGRILKMSAT